MEKNKKFCTLYSQQQTGRSQHSGFSQTGIQKYLQYQNINHQARLSKALRKKEKEFVAILKANFKLSGDSAADEKKKGTKKKTKLVVDANGDDGMGDLLGPTLAEYEPSDDEGSSA